MKIFTDVSSLAAATLTSDQIVKVKGVGEYRIQDAGTGITLANGKIAVPQASGTAISVRQFGAVGDGVTDDTAAIQTAIAQLSNNTIYFPEGTYRLTTELVIDNHSNFTICGEGTLNTADIPMATPKQNKVQVTNCSFGTITGITFEGDISSAEITAGDDTAQLEIAQSCSNIVVDRVRVVPVAAKQLCHGIGIYGNDCILQNSYLSTGQEFGIIIIRNRSTSGSIVIQNNTIEDFNTNIEPAYDTSNIIITGNTSKFSGAVGNHITIWPKGSTGGIVENVTITDNYCNGGATFLYMPIGDLIGNVADGIRNVTVKGNIIEDVVNANAAIQVTFNDITDTYLYQMDVSNNTFDGMEAGLISIAPNNSSTVKVGNISIKNNRYTAVANTISNLVYLYMPAGTHTGADVFTNWDVEGNTFNNLGTTSTTGLFILKHTSDFVLNKNKFINTNTSGGSFKDVDILAYCGDITIAHNGTLSKIADAGNYANTVVYNNDGIVTEAIGTGTIGSGASIAYFAHGLDNVSKLGLSNINNSRLKITPTNAAAGALGWYLFNISGNFIDFRSAANAPSDATFAWELTFSKPV